MWLTDLAEILRAEGLKVVEVDGWKTRGALGRGLSGMRGVMWHHTATPASAQGDYPSLGVVRDGRPGISGPLSQLGLGRSGTWYVIAAGRAHHAGAGSCSWMPTDQGNDFSVSVEAEHPGIPDVPWPTAQLDSYRRGTAALLQAYGLHSGRLIAHKEWAPDRKIDPISLYMSNERRIVANLMEDDMPTPAEYAKAVWDHAIADVTKPKDAAGRYPTMPARSFLSWMRRDTRRLYESLPELLNDESKLTRVINDAVDRVPGADPDVIKAAFLAALRELFAERVAEE